MFRTTFKIFQLISIIGLVLVNGVASSEILVLKDEREIQRAAQLKKSINRLSGKVMQCVKSQNGATEGCVCSDQESCKFKVEYNDVKESYCEAIALYPHWKGKSLNYTLPPNPVGHALGMIGFEKQFGRYCGQ